LGLVLTSFAGSEDLALSKTTGGSILL
jgi:hypothetical protein